MREEVVDKSSLTVAGLFDAVVHDWIDINSTRVELERAQDEQHRRKLSSCWAFGTKSDLATEHNEQVARLIRGLGDSSARRRAAPTAIAKRQGCNDDGIVEDMLHGWPDQKIDVPSGLRGAFNEIGLSHVMAPVNLMMTVEKGGQVLMTNDAWEDIEFEVALDSGSVVHVCAPDDCPGYMLQEPPGSKRGQAF